MSGEACSRCGGTVPSVLGPPPGDRDRWTRFGILIRRREVTYRLRLRMFTRQWLPVDPIDQLSETFTDLTLCDWCAGDVFLFAQGEPPRPRRAASAPTEGAGR